MQVLDEQDRRPRGGKAQDVAGQRLEGARSLLGRGERSQGPVAVLLDPEQVGQNLDQIG